MSRRQLSRAYLTRKGDINRVHSPIAIENAKEGDMEAPELYKEYIPEWEQSEIEQLLRIARDIHEYQRRHVGRCLRGQHAPDTGCVKAEFIVNPNLPADLQVGVFSAKTPFDAI